MQTEAELLRASQEGTSIGLELRSAQQGPPGAEKELRGKKATIVGGKGGHPRVPTTEILRLHCAQSSLLTPSPLPPLGRHHSSWQSLSHLSPPYEAQGAESKELRPRWVRPIPADLKCWSHCYPARHPLFTLQGPEVPPVPGSPCTSQCVHDARVMGAGCPGFQQMPYRGGPSPSWIPRGALPDPVLTQAICSQKEFSGMNNSTRNSRKTQAFVDSSLPCC